MNNYRVARKMAGLAAVLGLSILPVTMRAQSSSSGPAQDQNQAAPAQQPDHKGGAMEALNLTDDQKAQMKQIHQDTKSRIDAVNNDSTLSADQKAAKTKQIRHAAHKQMKKVLTPEQRQAMRARARARKQGAAPQPS
jgi:Spy/CpxP family protein refolding chaperone